MPFLGLKTGRRSVVPSFCGRYAPEEPRRALRSGDPAAQAAPPPCGEAQQGGGEQAAGKVRFAEGHRRFRCRLGRRSGTCLYPWRPSGPKPVQPVRKRSAGPYRTHRPKLLRIRRILFGRRVNPGIGLFRPRAFRRRLPRAASRQARRRATAPATGPRPAVPEGPPANELMDLYRCPQPNHKPESASRRSETGCLIPICWRCS